MGGVFLALTGAEALYADMGHVGPTAIRRAWFGLVLPALLLNYFGQGALVLADPHAVDSPFYKLAPHWALIPLVGLAALATIIASQALISGVFSLSRQAMQIGLCPRMRIVPTSSDEAGQIYVPTANWLLMAGTLLVVVLFKTSANLAGAYGIAVSGTMLITTLLLYRVAITRWKWPPAFAILIIVVFGAVDSIFLASNSLKDFRGRLVSDHGRVRHGRIDAVLAARFIARARAAARNVDAARNSSSTISTTWSWRVRRGWVCG